MRFLAWPLAILILGGAAAGSAQSLVELAKREKKRRQELENQTVSESTEPHLADRRGTSSESLASPPNEGKEGIQIAHKEAHPTSSDGPPGRTSAAPTPSLVTVAEKETARRQKQDNAGVQSFNDHHLARIRFGKRAVSAEEPASVDEGGDIVVSVAQGRESGEEETNSEDPSVKSAVLMSSIEETSPGSGEDVEFLRAGGGRVSGNHGGTKISTTEGQFVMPNALAPETFYLRGAIYADWFRATYDNGLSTSQFSNRVRLEMGRPPGDGWRLFLDVRDRFNKARGTNLLLVYDARLIYDEQSNPIELSLGQMNLYNSAGVGQLLGGVVGYQISPALTIGGYGGLQPNIYRLDVDPGYQKYGFYTQVRPTGAMTAALSYNRLRFDGETEREFIYTTGLVPVGDFAVFFGNLEYELSDHLADEDRLSQLFLNVRYNVTRTVDVTAHYSSGKGLDFHRFLIQQSQDPDRNSPELERFYYSKTYGVRLSVKPHRRVRLYVAQRESEQKDRAIRNHTTQIGGSAQNIGGSGISLYGSYYINRGDASESDSYRFSVSRDFGPLSWTAYYSSTFNGIRFDASTGLPTIVRISDRNTVSNDLFFSITRSLVVSFEHDYSSQGGEDENSLFFRVIYRL